MKEILFKFALEEIIKVIEAHDIKCESCDRDGEECCDCLYRAINKAKLILNS